MEKKWALLRFTIEKIGNEEGLGTQPILQFPWPGSELLLSFGKWRKLAHPPFEGLSEMSHLLMRFLALLINPHISNL